MQRTEPLVKRYADTSIVTFKVAMMKVVGIISRTGENFSLKAKFFKFFSKFKNEESYYVSLAATQVDDLGPADVLICCFDEIQFGEFNSDLELKFFNVFKLLL